jgi:hypothetical protein
MADPKLVPVDGDPFSAPSPGGPRLTPVDGDPFAGPGIGRKAVDAMSVFADAATFGLSDRLNSMASGKSLEEEQAKTRAAQERMGWGGTATQIAGSLLPAGLVAKGVGMAAKGASAAAPMISRAVSNPFAQAGATGAAYVTADQLGHDREVTPTDVAIGVGGGVAGQKVANVVGKGVGAVAEKFKTKPQVPARSEIEAAKTAAYDAADQAGVIFTPQMMQRVHADVVKDLTDFGFHPKMQPKIAAVVDEIAEAAQNNNTLKGSEVIRRIAQNAYVPGDKANNAMMQRILSRLDETVQNPQAGDVLMGDAQAGIGALRQGREQARRGFKLDAVDEQIEKATRQTASTGSGGNINNATRQKIRALLDNPSRRRGFSPDEVAAMEAIVRGSPTENIARLVGKLSPEGNGLMQMLHIMGGVGTGGSTLPLAAAGWGAKRYADKATANKVGDLRRIIAAGGSRDAAFGPPTAIQRGAQAMEAPAGRAALEPTGNLLDEIEDEIRRRIIGEQEQPRPFAAGGQVNKKPERPDDNVEDATFFGTRARKAPKYAEGALERAKELLGMGKPRDEVWRQTGASTDKSGALMGEISDHNARLLRPGLEALKDGQQIPLGELLHHPEVFDAYPSSFRARVQPQRGVGLNQGGFYDHYQDVIGINPNRLKSSILDTVLHENQHRIQNIEGWAPGASPKMFTGPDTDALDERILRMLGAIEAEDLYRRKPASTLADLLPELHKRGFTGVDIDAYTGLKTGAVDKDTIRKRIAEVELERAKRIAETPSQFEQYQGTLGEVQARMPGIRRRLNEEQRRWIYPFDDSKVTSILPNDGPPRDNPPSPEWERFKAERGFNSGGLVKLWNKLYPPGSGYKPPKGQPGTVKIPDIGEVEARPVGAIEAAKASYVQKRGMPLERPEFGALDTAFASRVADAFDQMPHNPRDPKVRRAYDALIDETLDQYKALKDAGVDFRFLKDGQKDPYARSPSQGYADLVQNGRLWVFPTEQGFGSSTRDVSDNPLLRRVGKVGDLDNATANDAFRVVHDAYGHFGPGNPFFRAPGEERAYRYHRGMYSPEARPAMATETRGQNSWVNYGPFGERNRTASGGDTVYADQKIGLLPPWAMEDPVKKERGGLAKIAKGALETWWHPASKVKLRRPLEEMEVGTERLDNLAEQKIISPEALQGKLLFPAVGDRTGAGYRVIDINGQKLLAPVEMQGGPDFMRGPAAQSDDQSAWASAQGRIKMMADKVRREAERTGLDPVLAHSAMGAKSGDFSHMVSDAILGQVGNSRILKKDAKEFDALMKERTPGWPGVLRPEEAMKFMREQPGVARAEMAKELDAASYAKSGFPDVGAARLATMDPALRDVENLSSGFALSRLDPMGRVITDPRVRHDTYDTHLGGAGYLGRLQELVPAKVMFPDWHKRLPEGSKNDIPQQQYALEKQFPAQVANQEWLDNVMRWIEESKAREPSAASARRR